MGLEEVSAVLWRERELLELLLFKLEEEQLVLASGRTRWLNHATREVEVVLEEIRHAEVRRSMEVDALAADLGLGAGPSLRQLVDVLPVPWSGIFERHRTAFLDASHEIQALANSNKELLTRGRQATEDALAWLTGRRPAENDDLRIYSASGAAAPPVALPRLVNEAL